MERHERITIYVNAKHGITDTFEYDSGTNSVQYDKVTNVIEASVGGLYPITSIVVSIRMWNDDMNFSKTRNFKCDDGIDPKDKLTILVQRCRQEFNDCANKTCGL